MDLRDHFRSPSAAYRGKPFWAWNGKLEEEEVRRQIRVFHQMGLGGGFMHSRVGLDTPYLSDEWFEIIKACVDECRQHDMEAWLYDEDRWPSGAAGGLVTKDPKYRHRSICCTVASPKRAKLTGAEVALFLAKMDGQSAYNVRRVKATGVKSAKRGEKLLIFTVRLDDCSPWFNGYTYLDTMSTEAVEKFLAVTHEAYAREIGDEFGPLVPGIFTDEPNYGGTRHDGNEWTAPWTGALPKTFKQRYGYDLRDHLPHIFFAIDGEAFSKVQRDYRDCITRLFTENFGRLIFEWCAQHKLLYTGHVLAEQTLTSQTSVVGSAMRFYEYMQAPGIDILRGQILKRRGGSPAEFSTAKQCSSVLHQFGRTWMLSELYGCTGWHFDFAEHKAVGDWQAALGVNLRCQHLSWYTMRGEAKRDYPASIFFQSPWWRDYHVVEDYFARVNLLMTQGEAVCDIGVLHPIESAWAVFSREGAALKTLERQWQTVQDGLLRQHFDFDYIDEDILARHGGLSKGRLRVGKANYSAIVVPPMLTMRSSTLKVLQRFAKAGGTVIFAGPVCPRVDCEESADVKALARDSIKTALKPSALSAALQDTDVRRVSIAAADGEEYPEALYMLRCDEKSGRAYVFVCRTEQKPGPVALRLTIPAQGQVQEWDAQTGQVYETASRATPDGVCVTTTLDGCGSRCFVVDPVAQAGLFERRTLKEVRRTKLNPKAWDIQRDEPNAFPLDVAEYALDGGAWQGPLEILQLDSAVRDAMGLPHRGGRMVQPWAQDVPAEMPSAPLALRYRFDVRAVPNGPCHLVIEQPERFHIELNGIELMADEDEGWWIDNSFTRIRVLPWFLKEGTNELVLTTLYDQTHGLEALYFTGEFGFKWRGTTPTVAALPTRLVPGNWVTKGFACYSGAMTYTTTFTNQVRRKERVVLEVPEWKGVVMKIRVNGVATGAVAWPPYEVDITDALVDGRNRLEIEIVSSRRNLLGPLHLKEKLPGWTGWSQFIHGEMTDKYVSVPYGLMAPPVLSTRK